MNGCIFASGITGFTGKFWLAVGWFPLALVGAGLGRRANHRSLPRCLKSDRHNWRLELSSPMLTWKTKSQPVLMSKLPAAQAAGLEVRGILAPGQTQLVRVK